MCLSLGELRHINKLRFWPLQDVLHDKYEFSEETSSTIGSFLTPMLRLNPDKRAGAGELTHHRWLDGVVVQGEIDVIRWAEEDEARRRGLSIGMGSGGRGGVARGDMAGGAGEGTGGLHHVVKGEHGEQLAVRASDEDALKPVDEPGDATTPGGTEEERPIKQQQNAPMLGMPKPGGKSVTAAHDSPKKGGSRGHK